MPCSSVDPIFVRLTRLVILAEYIVTEKCAGMFNIIESEDFRVKQCLVSIKHYHEPYHRVPL